MTLIRTTSFSLLCVKDLPWDDSGEPEKEELHEFLRRHAKELPERHLAGLVTVVDLRVFAVFGRGRVSRANARATVSVLRDSTLDP